MNVTVIAEAGINHNGDVTLAKKLISVARKANVDFVKFQKRDPNLYKDFIYHSPLFGDIPYKEHRQRLELSNSDFEEIDEYAHRLNIQWFASTFDIKSLYYIESFNPQVHKIGSPMVVDIDFVTEVAKLGKPVFMSTGMSTLAEIDNAVNTFLKYNNKLTLMHTTSIYPCPPGKTNLSLIPFFKRRYGLPVGYSSHDSGIPISLAAVGIGAVAIEKHITLDRTMAGTDHALSLEPLGLLSLTRSIRTLEKAIGTGKKIVFKEEWEVRDKVKTVKE